MFTLAAQFQKRKICINKQHVCNKLMIPWRGFAPKLANYCVKY